MLVMAGPGSGKSFVIIQRILNLIQEHKIYPQNILVISFSKASTLELKQRFQKQIRNTKSNNNQFIENQIDNNSINEKERVNFATFHACFFQILKDSYHYTSQNIITEKEKRDILRTILLDPEYGEKNIPEKIEDYLQKVSYYKNKGTGELKEKETKQFQKIYRAYNQEMHKLHRLDFEDMGLLCLQLFQNRPDILDKWQDKFQYVLIDEFQDINAIQFRIIQLLAGKYQNLFVVGDDDQAIYGFRGSNPKIMLDFEKYYPNTKKVLLETNYRCSEAIVTEALKVIEQNKVRFRKEIKAIPYEKIHNGNKGNENCKERKIIEKQQEIMNKKKSEDSVIYKKFENYHKEYSYIVGKIQDYVKKQGYNYSDIACIFRINGDMNGLAEYFTRKKIPFVMKESYSSIFKHFIALDIIAYLNFFLEGKKRSDFIRIMNKPLRYISRNAMSSINNEIVVWKELKEYYKSKRYITDNIEQLEKNDRCIQKLDLYGVCFYIRKVIGYDNYLKEYVKEQGINFEEAKEILDFIHESTRDMSSLEEWKEYIEEYEEAIKKSGEEKEGVHIITMHACKGLEYSIIFLPDCNEGKIPYKKAASSEAIEEERRMFYVAMTRAKTHLEMLYIEDDAKKHLQRSRFLVHNIKPIPKFPPAWKQ